MRELDRRFLPSRAGNEHGVALIIALMSMSLLMALGLALILTTTAETRIAGNYRQGSEAFYAADAAVERVIQDILTVPNWDDLLSGAVRSAFTDGPPAGTRTLPDRSRLDLTEVTNMARCGKILCSSSDLVAVTEDRPWGANNPLWQLYAYGPLDRMMPTGTINSRMYVIVWVADDSSDSDGDPLHDGAPPVGCSPDQDPACAAGNIGRGLIAMMARAIGPDGTQRTIEVTLARTDTTKFERGPTGRILSWREVR